MCDGASLPTNRRRLVISGLGMRPRVHCGNKFSRVVQWAHARILAPYFSGCNTVRHCTHHYGNVATKQALPECVSVLTYIVFGTCRRYFTCRSCDMGSGRCKYGIPLILYSDEMVPNTRPVSSQRGSQPCSCLSKLNLALAAPVADDSAPPASLVAQYW